MQSSGACPFLDENFLCKLQLKHGEEFLTAVCQSFPRVTYKLDAEIFLQAMTLTCPVAAILILLHDKITFEVVDELKARQIFDFTERIPDAEKFLERQQAAIKILQRRDLSINARLKNLCEFFGIKICADFDIPIEYRNEKMPKYVVITVAASKLGAYFTGGNGSTMYVDEFQFNY